MATLPPVILDDIDQRFTDQVLSNQGYPISRKWTNSTVRTVFGGCSKQHHMLQVLIQNYDWGVMWVDRWRRKETDTQGCLAFRSSTSRKYRTKLHGDCRKCGEAIQFTIVSSRLVAIFQRPVEEMWKGVLTQRRSPRRYVFEGSGRCNLFGHPNHCMTPSHLVLETFMHNAKRKSHHSGAQRCNCVRACIGESVRSQSEYLRFPELEPTEEVGPVVQHRAQTAIGTPKRAGSSVSRHGLSQQNSTAGWNDRVTKPSTRPKVRMPKEERVSSHIPFVDGSSNDFDLFEFMD